MKTVTIYTDGACSGNPGPGGWGGDPAVRQGGKGAFRLRAVHHEQPHGAARCNYRPRDPQGALCSVDLYSDSKYVVDGITKGWAKGWRARGWVKSDKKPAKNPELWGRLLDLLDKHEVRFHWVKGHADNPYNNRCDELAVGEYQKYK